MGLDIYYYNQHSHLKNEDYIWTVDESSFSHLTDCIHLYEKRTGKIIDEYGDLELPPGTLEPLLTCVHETIECETNHSKRATLSKLYEILVLASKNQRGIGLYGD